MKPKIGLKRKVARNPKRTSAKVGKTLNVCDLKGKLIFQGTVDKWQQWVKIR